MATKKSDMENERNEQKKTDDKTEFNLFNWPLGKKALIVIIGIIATALISDFVLHYRERNFPNVHFNIFVDGSYPCVHFLSDTVNKYTVATLDYKIPVQLSLENDNKAPIKINRVSLVIDNYKSIPRDSFLFLKDYFNQGEEDMVRLDTFKKINPSQNTYPLSIVDQDTGNRKKDSFLRLEAGLTDMYIADLDFDEEGLYEFHFDVEYVIHGKKHTVSTEKDKILHIHRTPEAINNPDNPELKNQLIISYVYGQAEYSIYGDGTMIINRIDSGDYLYEQYDYLLKRMVVEKGTQSIDNNYVLVAGSNVKEIYLPSTLNNICDGSFNEDSIYNQHIDGNSSEKTIIYDGTFSDWMNNVQVGNDNDMLYEYEFEFSDGSKGKLNDFDYTSNQTIE